MVNWRMGGHLPYICMHSAICETVFGVVVFHTSMINWHRGCICPWSICALCYMLNILGVVVFHSSMVNFAVGGYICFLLHVKLIWFSGIPYIYGGLEGGMYALGIYAFSYMWNLFCVVVFHRSMVNCSRGIHLPWQYMSIVLYGKLSLV